MFLQPKSLLLPALSLALLYSCKKEAVNRQPEPSSADSSHIIKSARYDIGIAPTPVTVDYGYQNEELKTLDGAEIKWDFAWHSGQMAYRKQSKKGVLNEKKEDSLFYTTEGRLARAERYQTWSDGTIEHTTREFAYNHQGQLISIELSGNLQNAWKKLDRWNFIYQNGNISVATYTLLAYGDPVLTTDYTFLYDGNTNVFGKAPLHSVLTNLLSADFNGAEIAFFFSKNNVVSTTSGRNEARFRYDLDNRNRFSDMQREGAGPFIEFFYLKN